MEWIYAQFNAHFNENIHDFDTFLNQDLVVSELLRL